MISKIILEIRAGAGRLHFPYIIAASLAIRREYYKYD